MGQKTRERWANSEAVRYVANILNASPRCAPISPANRTHIAFYSSSLSLYWIKPTLGEEVSAAVLGLGLAHP